MVNAHELNKYVNQLMWLNVEFLIDCNIGGGGGAFSYEKISGKYKHI